MAAEYIAAGENPYSEMYAEASENFQNFVARLRNYAKGLNLPDSWVPVSTFWLVDDNNCVLGCSRLHHRLSPELENEGGHIGYGIRPSQRHKGYGSLILALTLEKARQIGLNRILVTCDDDNIASAHIIEKNGGKFTDQTISKRTGKPVRRYWINL